MFRCVSYLRGLLLDAELVSMRNFRPYADFSRAQVPPLAPSRAPSLRRRAGGGAGRLNRDLPAS